MKKVYQQKVCSKSGDCARAVMASLFELDIRNVPKLKPNYKQAYNMKKFFRSMGHNSGVYNRRPHKDIPTLEEAAKFDGGIDGYFYAAVPSQTFDCVHAVVVDIDLNIVHDPNPNELCLKLKPEDVILIWTSRRWYVDRDGGFVETS